MKCHCQPALVILTAVLLAAAGGLGLVIAADPPAGDAALVVVDANGKEHKLKTWKFAVGIRHLSWLAPAPKDDAPPPPRPRPGDPPRPPAGPEAVEIRDDASLNPPLIAGFVTLVPLDRVRSIVFDDNEVMTVRLVGEKDDEIVTGTTKYKGINKITLEAEVDKGDLGIAEIKFLGGVPKGIKSLRFPTAKPGPLAAAGRAATVTTTDVKKTVHKVTDLQPLWKFATGERLVPTLMFKKTIKLDLDKITKIRASDNKEAEGEWTLALKQGDEETLTLLKQAMIDDKPAQFEGFVGRFGGVYKLFPAATIGEVSFEESK